MNRPQKKHCQYPLAALCLSCKWFRPDFLLHQWVICTTLAARLGTPGEPGQLCSVVCLFCADSLCRGNNKLEHWKSEAVSPRGNITAEALLLSLLVSVWAALLPTATQVATVCKIQALGDSATPGKEVLWAGWSHQWDTTGELRQTQNALAEPWYFQL